MKRSILRRLVRRHGIQVGDRLPEGFVRRHFADRLRGSPAWVSTVRLLCAAGFTWSQARAAREILTRDVVLVHDGRVTVRLARVDLVDGMIRARRPRPDAAQCHSAALARFEQALHQGRL